MPQQLQIREDFRDLCPPLTPFEREQLENSICARGCLNPIIVWRKKGIILDGHNRYEICHRRDIEFQVFEEQCASEDLARNFIIRNQLGRRNLAPDIAAILRGKLYIAKKKDRGRPKKTEDAQLIPQSEGLNTSDEIAALTGVSRSTIERDAKFAESCDTLGITQDVMAGKEKRSRKEIVEAAKKQKKTQPRQTKTPLVVITNAIGKAVAKMTRDEKLNLFDEIHAWLTRNS
jgi:ParB-like chromosome segregation protein Spo0J